MPKDKRPRGAAGRQQAQGVKHPRKALYRARAHANPLSDSQWPVPARPSDYNWSDHFQEFFQAAKGTATALNDLRFADVGCGFGGLLVRLSPLYPDKLMVGMEIRDKVTNYVIERVSALRREQPGKFNNITALRTNAMRHLPNFFLKGQLHKLFFLFPDPHFKTANHRRRIIQTFLLAEYAFILAVGGMLYTITDVQELGEWMRSKLDAHPLFQRISDEELDSDPAANLLTSASEEAQKVARNEGKTFRNVYRRICDEDV
ncbi:hypothetical protein WJX79_002218 [Trebouxia sp. C0005]